LRPALYLHYIPECGCCQGAYNANEVLQESDRIGFGVNIHKSGREPGHRNQPVLGWMLEVQTEDEKDMDSYFDRIIAGGRLWKEYQ
jgi:hypothetical protein